MRQGSVAASVASHVSTMFVFNTFRPSGLRLDWREMLASENRAFVLQLKGLEYSLEARCDGVLALEFDRLRRIARSRALAVLRRARRGAQAVVRSRLPGREAPAGGKEIWPRIDPGLATPAIFHSITTTAPLGVV